MVLVAKWQVSSSNWHFKLGSFKVKSKKVFPCLYGLLSVSCVSIDIVMFLFRKYLVSFVVWLFKCTVSQNISRSGFVVVNLFGCCGCQQVNDNI